MTPPAGEMASGGLGFYRFEYLLATAFITVAYLAFAVAWPIPIARVVLGVFLLFFAPGYALGALLLGRRSGLPRTADFAITVGLSAVFNIVVGLGLEIARVGLSVTVFAIATLVVLVVAILRFQKAGEKGSFSGFLYTLQAELALPGFSRRQRVAAYSLLLAIGVVLTGMVYMSALMPNDVADTRLAVTGWNGTVWSLPTSGRSNTNLSVIVEVRNGVPGQPLNLNVQANLLTSNATNRTVIAWTTPLLLGPGVESSLPLGLEPGQQTSVNVTFRFAASGQYVVKFTLVSNSGSVMRRSDLALTILR